MSTVRNDTIFRLKGNNKLNMTYPSCSCKHNFGLSILSGNEKIRENMEGGARNYSAKGEAKGTAAHFLKAGWGR